MTTPTKPILHNGFKVRDDLVVKIRIERIFLQRFTNFLMENFYISSPICDQRKLLTEEKNMT